MTIKHKQYLWLEIDGDDSWYSSQLLIKNLKRCYHKKLGTSFYTASLPVDLETVRELIFKHKITSVIIADPRINLFAMLRLLCEVSNKEVEFLIHVIGSPIRKLSDLKQMGIDDLKICLIASSKVNYEILKNFTSGNVKYFPFLPDSTLPPKAISNSIKNKFIYFGRISFQKNLTGLLELFAKYQTEVNPKAELSIYGGASNSHFPTKPRGHYIGMAAEKFFLKLAELQQKGHKIKYFGLIDQEEMESIIKENNTFISLSTAEEEDFGMSLYEAIGLGLSCVISKWGGHKEFIGFKQVSLIDIIHKDNTLYLDENQFFQALEDQNQNVVPQFDSWFEERENIINELDLNFEFKSFTINLKSHFSKEEFFNEHQENVSPYWR